MNAIIIISSLFVYAGLNVAKLIKIIAPFWPAIFLAYATLTGVMLLIVHLLGE